MHYLVDRFITFFHINKIKGLKLHHFINEMITLPEEIVITSSRIHSTCLFHIPSLDSPISVTFFINNVKLIIKATGATIN
jgi:hypothetical protein